MVGSRGPLSDGMGLLAYCGNIMERTVGILWKCYGSGFLGYYGNKEHSL